MAKPLRDLSAYRQYRNCAEKTKTDRNSESSAENRAIASNYAADVSVSTAPVGNFAEDFEHRMCGTRRTAGLDPTSQGFEDLVVKAGICTGPVIAVEKEESGDYFRHQSDRAVHIMTYRKNLNFSRSWP